MTERTNPPASPRGLLFESLAAAQSEFKAVAKNGKANYGRYATLDEILNATRPALNKCGCYLFQRVEAADGGLTVETLIGHKSGETLSSGKLFMPTTAVRGGNAAQAMGSARTYACRYSLASFLGVAADDDDDGKAAGAEEAEQPIASDALIATSKAQASGGRENFRAFYKTLLPSERKALQPYIKELEAISTEADAKKGV